MNKIPKSIIQPNSQEIINGWFDEFQKFIIETNLKKYQIFDVDDIDYEKMKLNLNLIDHNDEHIHFASNMNNNDVCKIVKVKLLQNINIEDKTVGKMKLVLVGY